MGRMSPALPNRLRALAGSAAAPRMSRWRRGVEEIGRLEPEMTRLSDARLRKLSLDLRWRAKGGEPLWRLLPQAFALVREAARRTIGLRHYDVQLLAGSALTEHCILEMATGEGKTLVATLPAYLNALTGRGVHVVTVNDYLAARDADWMGPVYRTLGLTVGCIQTSMAAGERRTAYACDVTYGTAKEFGFDFLRDRLATAGGGQSGALNWSTLFGQTGDNGTGAQRGHHCAIVDEADSILIDEARTPLIISAPVSDRERQAEAAFRWADEAARQLQEGAHYTYDIEKRSAELNMRGCWKVRALPMPKELSSVGLDEIYEYVERAVMVQREYHLDRHYVVVDDEIVIVDEYTGRTMAGRKWRAGVHQAIEAKEDVPVTVATSQAARTTIQSYFLRYEKLAGMTGTAWSSRRELRRIYKLRAVRVPTHRPVRRTVFPDRVFADARQKWAAVVEGIRQLHAQGRPLLIGTRSIETSERLSAQLDQVGIRHTVLNAKNDAREAEIVARAGQRGAVTIATNMAGRGTDIKLGGGVVELGGLHVIGTERHESRRIDNQLAGRSARQGDPGSCQFFLSLDDELLGALGPKTVRRLRRTYQSQGVADWSGTLDHLSHLFRRAQRRVERRHFRERAKLMRYEQKRTEMQENMGLDPVLNTAE